MKNLGLFLASAIIVSGFSLSISPSLADEINDDELVYTLLDDGEIILATGDGTGQLLSIKYDNQIYTCRIQFAATVCIKGTHKYIDRDSGD